MGCDFPSDSRRSRKSRANLARAQCDTSKQKRATNEKQFHKIHYRAPGTELTVELPLIIFGEAVPLRMKREASISTRISRQRKCLFPLIDWVRTVQFAATKPLSYQGNLIDNFSITFDNGRVIDYTAETRLRIACKR